MKRFLVLLFLIFQFIHPLDAASEPNYKVDLDDISERIEEINDSLSSQKTLKEDQYKKSRAEIVDIIDQLNKQKDSLADRITHSTPEEKAKLQPVLERLNETLAVSNKILLTLDNKEIQSTLLKHIRAETPLYDTSFMAAAYVDGIQTTKEISSRVFQSAVNIVKNAKTHPSYIYWIIWIVLCIGAIPFSTLLRKKVTHPDIKNSYLNKIKKYIVFVITGSVIPIVLIGGFFLINFESKSFLFTPSEVLVTYLVAAFIWCSIQTTSAFINPKDYQWSLLSISKEVAQHRSRRISLFLVFLALRLWLNELVKPSGFVQYLELGVQTLLSIQAIFIINVTQFRSSIKFILRTLAISVPILIFTGYRPLSDMILNGTLFSVIIYLIFHSISYSFKRTLMHLFKETDSIILSSQTSRKTSEFIIYWTHAFFVIVLFFIALYAAALGWGIDQTYLNSLASRALFGFTIGSTTISLINFLFSATAFLLLMLATKYSQTVLEKHVFPFTNFDAGLKNTLKTAAGYIGFIIAFIISIKMLGVNLSSLLFILGGLSVGIGLGLQPIVTNFISGLIMLIERPIQIGDFIELDGEMGIVKKINVRTTEIESFQKCSVLYPNTQVVSSMVKNWTKNDRIQRIDINIPVSYDSNTKLVESILLECAKDNETILEFPAPYVIFAEFGDTSLNFTLRCYLKDLSSVFSTGNAIKHAIIESLKTHQISIPYPQTDVHFDQEFIDSLKNSRRS